MTIKQRVKDLTPECWNVGFITNSLDSILRGEEVQVEWVRHGMKDRWFADPFILDVTSSEITLLVEEYYEPIRRGRISRLVVDRNTMQLKDLSTVLQLGTHLSFPVIRRVGSEVFICPENSASGKLTRYKYDVATNRCLDSTVVCDAPLADAVDTTLFGDRLLFCTRQPNPNGNELAIFEWNEAAGKYEPRQTCQFEENIARMAGDFFEYDRKIYRPAQECNV